MRDNVVTASIRTPTQPSPIEGEGFRRTAKPMDKPAKGLIVTADDFGLAEPVNEAVEIAHTRGILTCASLMVSGRAVADAVKRARKLPDLKVGLHVVQIGRAHV